MTSNEEQENLKTVLYIVMGLASLGLIFFIINFIRCRMSRAHLEEYEDEEENKINISYKSN